MMTEKEASARAAALGLSAWVTQAVAAGRKSKVIDLYCVGFSSINLPLVEGMTWVEAFDTFSKIIK